MTAETASVILRLAAWGCVCAVALLSLLPADEVVRTTLGGHVEHAIAYTVLAALVRLGYPVPKPGWIVLALVVYAGALEWLQHFSPGRTPAVGDWLSSSAGVLIGSAVMLCADRIPGRRGGRVP